MLLDEGGGAPLTVARLPEPGLLAHMSFAWDSSDRIVAGWVGPLLTVGAAGGELDELPLHGFTVEDFVQGFPSFLPDERRLLFSSTDRLELLELETGLRTELLHVEGGALRATNARYLPTGHLVYGLSGSIMAVPFDLEAGVIVGTPTPVVSRVYSSGRIGSHYFTVSPQGRLIYVEGVSGNGLAWVDRDGTPDLLEGADGTYRWPRVSSDGRQIAVTVATPATPATGVTGLWIGGLNLDRMRPLGSGFTVQGIWHPEDEAIVAVTPSGIINRFESDGTATTLVSMGGATAPRSWTPEGALLIEFEGDILALDEEGETRPVLATPADELAPAMSPDGRWLAYVSNESGQMEVMVSAWRLTGASTRISVNGGGEPAWSRDGSELFYRDGIQMLAVAVGADGTFGQPEVLFERRFGTDLGQVANYDVGEDGRFLMVVTEEDASDVQVNIVENWFSELERLVPVP